MLRLNIDASKIEDTIEVELPSSKSISNRVLMIHKIGELSSKIDNLSDAEDTVFLQKILESNSDDVYCGAGGTTIRFYLSYCYLKDKLVVIRGDESLNSRPVFPLVDALTQLGADITYLYQKGCAPIKIVDTEKNDNKVVLTENISSQFVSSLLLIAPYLPQGLEIEFPSAQVSRSYISMTISLMNYFGVKVEDFENRLIVKPQHYLNTDFRIASDWSAVIYWIGILAIRGSGCFSFKNLRCEQLQGDEVLMDWLEQLGITVSITEAGMIFNKSKPISVTELNFDLINNPDLAQPLAVISAALGIRTRLTGLSTLKFKESDRLKAISNELKKVGVEVSFTDDSLDVNGKVEVESFDSIAFDTYHDHRMAMSLSMLLALGKEIKINNPEVVTKSYPRYFDELKKICLITEE